jgi:hypothetical protein
MTQRKRFTAMAKVLYAAAALWAGSGCSDDGQATGSSADATASDSAIDSSAVEDSVAELPTLPDSAEADSGNANTDSSSSPETAPSDGACSEGGCACSTGSTCNTGLCIEIGGGKQCASLCQGGCAAGLQCSPVPTPGGDIVSVCVPAQPRLCEPCMADSDCNNVLGGADNRCVPYNDGSGALLGHFCGTPCADSSTCPGGYSCAQQTSIGGVKAKMCVKQDLVCPCDARAVQLGLSTTCTNVNPIGTCSGKRTCSDAGLSACTAATAAVELCNLKDDDCDGQTDEMEAGLCSDGSPCTFDLCSNGSCQQIPNPGPCDDGDACTSDDACSGVQCVGKPVACDDGNPCTSDSCDKAKGCVTVPADGQPCSDGSACSTTDSCKGGVCLGGAATVCDDGNPCTTDGCDQTSGCVFSDNALPCTDGDACTLGDTCSGGQCKGLSALPCNDGNPCTTDSCDAKAGCQFQDNTLPCDDFNSCTVGETCKNGTCTPDKPAACDDGNPCTTDACDAKGGCSATPNTAPCDDGSVCTWGDICAGGACKPGKALACKDGNPCTDDSCDAATGCQFVANSAPCSDGNTCTESDSCADGVCTPGTAKACDDGNPCTTDACDPKGGCVASPNTAPCDDGSLCTSGDVCGGGQCNPGKVVSCDDGNPCTNDSCDPAQGCFQLANAAPCSDNNVCTQDDTCSDGKCLPGLPVNCDDGNVCTDDQCLPTKGCDTKDNTASCSDGNVCSGADVCKGGACIAGQAVTCNDGNPCTDDSCNPLQGCVFVANSAPCDDNNGCTSGDVCKDGACSGPIGCDVHAQCAAGAKSVSCQCKLGYSGDGFSCGDVDECTQGTATCPANTACQNKAGGYDCVCVQGFGDCDANLGNGCEAEFAVTAAHCGGCGIACSSQNIAVPACAASTCSGACNAGFGDCNGDKLKDGCETPTGADSGNCGGCGQVCSSQNIANPTCAAGVCNGACSSGFGDCNGDKLKDGCETNLLASQSHCGACGTVCAAGTTCTSGTCVVDPFGSGVDGPLVVGNGQTVTASTVRTTVSGAQGQTAITLGNASGFVKGQAVLLHQTQGASAGTYEVNTLSSVSGNSATVALPLKSNYSNAGSARAQIVVVRQHTDITVSPGGTLTAPPWDGASGGILALMASGTVTVQGSVTMSGRGFRGMSHGCFYRCQPGWNGEGTAGTMVNSVGNSNGNGGGGGRQGQDCGQGAGGGHALPGVVGLSSATGNCGGGSGSVPGGVAVGVASLASIANFGGAGGEGGGDEDGGNPGGGGNGGGLILLQGATVTVTGSITSDGSSGGNGNQGACGGTGSGMSGGGGGAGGSIRIFATTANLGNKLVSAAGAMGGLCWSGGTGAGTGSEGRIGVKANATSGTTSPAYTSN